MLKQFTSGSGAAVARLLAKEKVEGSNPFFRSILLHPHPPRSAGAVSGNDRAT